MIDCELGKDIQTLQATEAICYNFVVEICCLLGLLITEIFVSGILAFPLGVLISIVQVFRLNSRHL